MIAYTCRKCGSTDLKKNGHTRSGRQKMYCKAYHFSSSLELQDLERRLKEEQVEKLSVLDKAAPPGPVRLERTSQRAIARTTGVSRMTIAKLQKKVASLLPKP